MFVSDFFLKLQYHIFFSINSFYKKNQSYNTNFYILILKKRQQLIVIFLIFKAKLLLILKVDSCNTGFIKPI